MTSRLLAAVLLIVGLALSGSGAVFGFSGITADGTSCGSAFKPDRVSSIGADLRDDTGSLGGLLTSDSSHQDACADATSGRKTLALALLVPGVLVLLAGLGLGGLEARRHWEREADATAHDVQPTGMS